MSKQDAARARAVRAVQIYEERKRALQVRMRGVLEGAYDKIKELLVDWGELAHETDEELAEWARSLGYDPQAAGHEEKGLDPSPFISSEPIDDFLMELQDVRVIDEVFQNLLAGEGEPFPSEPSDWTAEDAIGVIEETEPWEEPK